jgi:hypothetical protein
MKGLDWYYEQMTMTGVWSPVMAGAKPDFQVKGGVARLRLTGGWCPRIRAVQRIPENLRGLPPRALQDLLSTDEIEVAA